MRNKLFEKAECICIQNQFSMITFVAILAFIGRVHRTTNKPAELNGAIWENGKQYQHFIIKPSNTANSSNTCSVDHWNRNYFFTNSNQTYFLGKVSLIVLKSVGAYQRHRVFFYMNTVFRRKPKELDCPVPEEPKERKSTWNRTKKHPVLRVHKSVTHICIFVQKYLSIFLPSATRRWMITIYLSPPS